MRDRISVVVTMMAPSSPRRSTKRLDGWGNLDFQSRFLLVQRNYTHGKVTTPESGEVRQVDMS